jgi:hypothetical protein
MKHLLIFSFLLAGITFNLSAQSVDYNDLDNWTDICFCSPNNSFHPRTIVKADNNWQLLFAMRNGLIQKDLDSLKIPYTQSQLLLLRSQRLLQQRQGVYKTSILILDKEQTIQLRKQSHLAAERIFPSIEKDCNELVTYLSKNNRSKNAFSILFSYVLDGLIWDKLESEKLIEEREEKNIWSGSYWFLTPKRHF